MNDYEVFQNVKKKKSCVMKFRASVYFLPLPLEVLNLHLMFFDPRLH